MTCPDAAQALDPYIDGELPPDERSALHAHLESCAACRQRLEARTALRQQIRRVPYRAAPARLRVAIAAAPRPSRFTPMLAWAAVVLLGVSLGAAGLAVYAARSRDTAAASAILAEAVVDGHVRALMGDHLLDVPSSDQHTVKPWFLGKLDFAPPVTDLAPQGFPLVGGRLDYVGGHTAAALVYQRRGHTINLFIWPEAGGGRGEARAVRGFNVQHWTRGGMSFYAVSDLNAAELADFARALQQ